MGFKKPPITNANLLYGIDLNENIVLWEREVDRRYGVGEVVHLNDSIVILSASGLHTMNLKSGRGWTVKAVTGDESKDYSKYVGIGLAFGLIGVVVTAVIDEANDYPGKDMKVSATGIDSNILTDGDYIFYASKNEVIKMTKTGDLIWSKPISAGYGSRTFIDTEGDNLLVVNKGTALSPKKQIKYGKPLLSVYNKVTGKEETVCPLNGIANGVVSDCKVEKGGLAILMKDTLIQIKENSQIKIFSFSGMKKEKPIGFLDDRNYTSFGDSIFVKTRDYYLGQYHLIAKKNMIYRLDENLEEQEVKLIDNIWNQVAAYKSFRILSDKETALIINGKGQKIASFPMDSNLHISGSFVYFTQENKLKILDLSQFE